MVIDVEPAQFEDMVVTALDSLPEDLGRLMRNVAVTVEHGPGRPGLLGLYQGIPLTSRTTQYAGVLPDRITIYRRAICAICDTEAQVVEQVRRTVIHEVAHHFGIDDARLTELGWRAPAASRVTRTADVRSRGGRSRTDARASAFIRRLPAEHERQAKLPVSTESAGETPDPPPPPGGSPCADCLPARSPSHAWNSTSQPVDTAPNKTHMSTKYRCGKR